MKQTYIFTAFTLDAQSFALPVSSVERVVRVTEVTPLPEAPDVVYGIINYKGQVIPVCNIRRRFGFPDIEINLSHQFIIARTSKRTVALLVDDVTGTVEREENEIVPAGQVLQEMKYVRGIVKLEDGLVLIHDLDEFLSLDEERVLEKALSNNAV